MASYQLFSATSNSSTTTPGAGELQPAPLTKNSNAFTGEFDGESGAPIGVLDIFVHQARDIHNICIYHKQDVYAKLCLTSDPDAAVSTKIINGGGRNPVFNESVRLNVRTIESSVKCELWMLSRVRNYLEDQLLGFALVPLAYILVANGSLADEFSLSSTDLFHSPAGFVQLSLSYSGAPPNVMVIRARPRTALPDSTLPDAEAEDSISCEIGKIEFPDPKIANENHRMVSEYLGLHGTDMDTQRSDSLVTSESGSGLDEDASGVRLVESFSSSHGAAKNDTPVSSVSTAESPVAPPLPTRSISDTMSAVASPSAKDKSNSEVGESEADSCGHSKPLISISIEQEQTVIQQDIVDMYMKSMQEFTESLAKMKLPNEIENSSPSGEKSGKSADDDKNIPTPRVFYGSRAFF